MGSKSDQRYNRWGLMVSLLLLVLIGLVIQVGPFIVLGLVLTSIVRISLIWLTPWFAFLIAINLGSLKLQLKIMPQNPIWRFLLNWTWTPAVGSIIAASLIVQIVMHLPAWLTCRDLSLEDSRTTYYAVYSVSSIFLGVALLLLALISDR